MAEFRPDDYGAAFAACWDTQRLCELGPGEPNTSLLPALESLTVESAFAGRPVVDRQMAAGCLAGAWLWNDFLERSHEISQDVGTPTGSYWHGIMHRREPDYSNAKYWFRRVGQHPVFADLCAEAGRLAEASLDVGAAAFLTDQQPWDPFRFVDLCAEVYETGKPVEMLCRRIAARECELLFDFCYRAAVSG